MKIMQVEFHKTGEWRYAVVVLREGLPDLKMNPAPGFDPLMPHDMLHFLVEQELGLGRGIFGQIALGGTAGTFFNQPSEMSNNRADARLRRKTAKRGKKLLKENSDDCAQSERATFICLYDWLAHSADEKLRLRASEMKANYDSVLGQMTESERKILNKEKLAEIRRRMNDLSERWSALQVNQSMTLEWSLK
jgi:hypothetical protein